MTHTYQITGLTCANCEAKVKGGLLALPDITDVDVSKETGKASITMNKHIALADLQQAIGNKYQIQAISHNESAQQAKYWFVTYKPILLIFAYITLLTLLIQLSNTRFDGMQWMQHFMAGFFLTFSFFKMLDLQSFADSYARYDLIAKHFKIWGFLYPFVELALGIAFALNFEAFFTNLITVFVMGISSIGVLQSLYAKKTIQCACLGAVFNLPMSTVTFLEDLLMVAMSLTALLLI